MPEGLAAVPNFKYSLTPTPAWTAGAKKWNGASDTALSIKTKSPNLQDALNFVRFMFEPELYATIMNESLGIPAIKAAVPGVTNSHIKTMASWLSEGLGAPHVLYGPGSEVGLSNACVAIVQGKATPKQAAASIQATVDQARSR